MGVTLTLRANAILNATLICHLPDDGLFSSATFSRSAVPSSDTSVVLTPFLCLMDIMVSKAPMHGSSHCSCREHLRQHKVNGHPRASTVLPVRPGLRGPSSAAFLSSLHISTSQQSFSEPNTRTYEQCVCEAHWQEAGPPLRSQQLLPLSLPEHASRCSITRVVHIPPTAACTRGVQEQACG